MIKLIDTEITEEQFRELAEREGYVKEFEYPIYKESVSVGVVIRFTALRIGTVIVAGRYSAKVGTETYGLKPHTSDYWKEWNPHEELKKQYAEDAKTTDEPWRLWQNRESRGVWCDCVTNPNWINVKKYRRKESKPKTYVGLTLKQLNQAKAEGLLFEFWDTMDSGVHAGLLESVITMRNYPYISGVGFYGSDKWKHCCIHRSQPQYVIDGKKPDWLDDDTIIIVKRLNNSIPRHCKARDVTWETIGRFQVVGL